MTIMVLTTGYRPIGGLVLVGAGTWAGVVLMSAIAGTCGAIDFLRPPTSYYVTLWIDAGLGLLAAGTAAGGMVRESRQLGWILLTLAILAASVSLFARLAALQL